VQRSLSVCRSWWKRTNGCPEWVPTARLLTCCMNCLLTYRYDAAHYISSASYCYVSLLAPHTAMSHYISSASYCYVCVLSGALILLYVSSCYYMCVLMLLYVCPDTCHATYRGPARRRHCRGGVVTVSLCRFHPLHHQAWALQVCWRMLTYADVC